MGTVEARVGEAPVGVNPAVVVLSCLCTGEVNSGECAVFKQL